MNNHSVLDGSDNRKCAGHSVLTRRCSRAWAMVGGKFIKLEAKTKRAKNKLRPMTRQRASIWSHNQRRARAGCGAGQGGTCLSDTGGREDVAHCHRKIWFWRKPTSQRISARRLSSLDGGAMGSAQGQGATHDNLNKAIAKYTCSPPSRSASQKLDPN